MFCVFCCVAAFCVVVSVIKIYYACRLLKAYVVYRLKWRRTLRAGHFDYDRCWDDAHDSYCAFRDIKKKLLD